MAAGKEREWTVIYQTPSPMDADLVRTTLEVAGYPVWVQGGNPPSVITTTYDTSGALTVSVPSEDADDARVFVKQKTSLMPDDAIPAGPAGENPVPQESLEEGGQEILELGRQHELAAGKNWGVSTLEL